MTPLTRGAARVVLVLLAMSWLTALPVSAQESFLLQPGGTPPGAMVEEEPPAGMDQLRELGTSAVRLPLAGLLATVLALRPRRRGTPERKPAVIQTQVILAVIGSLVMLVVGTSLARAFGIVGAAGLVRYRAKIEDPKDAGVMLSTLAIGLASGVGLWVLAIFGTLFILLLLWIVESFEPVATRRLNLRIKSSDPGALKPRLERLLEQARAKCELRAFTPEELHYEVSWPIDRTTDELSERIVRVLGGAGEADVEIEPLKQKG